mgnify:CR=1 FL=1
MKMFPIFEHAPVIVCSCILGLLLSPPTAHAVQANRFVDESVQAPIRETLTLEDTIRMTLAISLSMV